MRTGIRTGIAAAAIVASALAGCHAVMPSGFWKSYRSNSIVKQFSDQGPWGGERWILWNSGGGDTFSEAGARGFAESHGWKFLERVEVAEAAIGDSPLFRSGHDRAREDFPKFISGASVVLKFDSGWMREDPGTTEMTTAYGYVQLSKDSRQMVVFHLWGNS